MQMIQTWFQGGPSSQGENDSVSLLEGWKQYEAQSSVKSQGPLDLESGFESFAPVIQNASDTVTGAWSTVSKNVQDLPGSIQKGASILPSRQALMYFGAVLSAGILFLMIAVTMFLPVMVLAPQKFAICFTLGCLLVMASFFVLKGPMVQLQHMISADRLPSTAFFVGSMICTIYSSVIMHSYLLSVIFSGIQVFSLLYYVVSYFPGGATGMRFISSMVTSTILSCFGR